MIKKLKDYIGEYKKVTILTPLFTAGEVFLEVAIPFVTSMLIDKGIEQKNFTNVLLYGGLMLALAFLALYFGKRAGECAAEASTGFASNVREGIYRKIQTFSFSNIDHFSTAGLVTRLTTDVTNLQNAFMMVIRVAVRPPLMLVSSIIMCVIISPSLSTIFLVAIVILSVFGLQLISRANRYFHETFNKYDDLNASVQENVSASRVVKAYAREGYETDKFTKAATNLRNLFVRAEKLITYTNPLMMLVIYGCIVALSWFGAHQVVGGTLTTGELTSMFSYVMSILMSLMMLSMFVVMISMSTASIDRISEVLSEESEIVDPEDPIEKVKDGSIKFEHVSFKYGKEGEDVLHDIDLSISSGETIGVIGGTGSGKSTLVSLISRLYDATQGEVFVGGENVRKYKLDVLRNEVAVVLQNNTLFTGSILDNLRWGNKDASEEECKEACRLACADDFIETFPDKYNTHIEQGGNNVSGGQKQRLCIARALLKSPKILILDDSTSAVDTATDASIRNSFATKIPHTTKIIISQRISSVQNADKIIVLDDGKVSGFDTHDNLLKNNEIYKDIYEVQTSGGGDFDAPTKD